MKTNPKAGGTVILLVVLGCVVMAWVEGGLRPTYPLKSAIKIAVFLSCGGAYALALGTDYPFRALRLPERGTGKGAAVLAGGVFLLLLGGYALLSPWLDLSAVPDRLAEKEGITAAVFPLAALYISFGNSLLEEFFFRGFAFLALREAGWRRTAWLFSALAFALYHVCIMDGWFHPALLVLFTAALAGVGLLFSWLDRRGSLWNAWLVHMAANLAINTIGMALLRQSGVQ